MCTRQACCTTNGVYMLLLVKGQTGGKVRVIKRNKGSVGLVLHFTPKPPK